MSSPQVNCPPWSPNGQGCLPVHSRQRVSRGERGRTSDLLVPNQTRYHFATPRKHFVAAGGLEPHPVWHMKPSSRSPGRCEKARSSGLSPTDLELPPPRSPFAGPGPHEQAVEGLNLADQFWRPIRSQSCARTVSAPGRTRTCALRVRSAALLISTKLRGHGDVCGT